MLGTLTNEQKNVFKFICKCAIENCEPVGNKEYVTIPFSQFEENNCYPDGQATLKNISEDIRCIIPWARVKMSLDSSTTSYRYAISAYDIAEDFVRITINLYLIEAIYEQAFANAD